MSAVDPRLIAGWLTGISRLRRQRSGSVVGSAYDNDIRCVLLLSFRSEGLSYLSIASRTDDFRNSFRD